MDPIFIAGRLAQDWTALLDEAMPDELRTAIEVFRAVDQVPAPEKPIDSDTITPANAEKRLLDYATALAAQQQFGEARKRVLHALGSKVSQAAYNSVEHVRGKILQPRLDTAAATFTQAVTVIGDGALSPAELVNRGGSAVDAFHSAIQAQAEIAVLDRWAAGLTSFMGGAADPACRISAPTTRAQLQALDNAHASRGSSDLNRLYVEIVHQDVPFRLNTPAEAQAIRTRIANLPNDKKPRNGFSRWA